jgi:hypothetical protein
MDAQVALIDYFNVIIRQFQPDGHSIAIYCVETNRTFSNVQELNVLNTSFIMQAVRTLLTNTSSNVHLDMPFVVYGNGLICGYKIIGGTHLFSLIYTNGSYILPTFPPMINVELYRFSCAFRVPKIKSAIIEVFKSGTWKVVTDSRLTITHPWDYVANGISGGIDTASQVLVVPPEFVVGNFPVRISMAIGSSNSFVLTDETGYQITETPTVLDTPTCSNGTIYIHGSGGDPGRYLTIQSSTDMVTWGDLPELHQVGYIGADSGITYSEPFGTQQRKFFRIKKVNGTF